MKLSILVPVYNEEHTIGQVIEKLKKLHLSVEKEIIVIDDASSDNTLKNINRKGIKLLMHKKNLGKGAALKTGIKKSTGDYIVIQDADLEYDPEEIKKLIAIVKDKKADIVYGTRHNRPPDFKRKERNAKFFSHYLGNKILSLLASVLYGKKVTDISTAYKLFPASIVKEMKLKKNDFDMDVELTSKLLKTKLKLVEVPINFYPREIKEGKKFRTFIDGPMAFLALIRFRIHD